MKKENIFYCCNRDEKIMPGGEVSRILDYPWSRDDEIFIDEICPFTRFVFSSGRAKRGAKIFGIRFPFLNYFDGNIRHRLVALNTNK